MSFQIQKNTKRLCWLKCICNFDIFSMLPSKLLVPSICYESWYFVSMEWEMSFRTKEFEMGGKWRKPLKSAVDPLWDIQGKNYSKSENHFRSIGAHFRFSKNNLNGIHASHFFRKWFQWCHSCQKHTFLLVSKYFEFIIVWMPTLKAIRS